jgi:hypothetical protein
LTYNPDFVIGTESWRREEIGNAEVFRSDFTTFRRDRRTRGGGVYICVKNYIACADLWVDGYFEMIAVEVKGMDPKYTWEIVGIYSAPCEDMRVIERLAARAGYSRNPTKPSIIGGDLNLPQGDWNGNAEGANGTQAFLNRLVWENGYLQVVGSPTRGDALLGPRILLSPAALCRGSPLRGIIRSRMGRNLPCATSGKTSPRVSQNR